MTENNIEGQGVKRRSVVKAAAWAAPVVAVAAAAPMAAASAEQATISVGTGTSIDGNFGTGAVSGTLGGHIQINNIVGSAWETGVLSSESDVRDANGLTATWSNGSLAGQPVTAGSFVNTIGGIAWAVSVTTSATRFVILSTAPSQTAQATFPVPAVSFSGTALGTAPNFDTVQARQRIRVANVNGGNWSTRTIQEWPSGD